MTKTLHSTLGVKVSHTSVQRLMHSWGWVPHKRTVECILTATQIKKRIKWCNEYKNKSVEWWQHCIFGDEKNFGETWDGNPKDDIVWNRPGMKPPSRSKKKYGYSIKVGIVASYHGLSPVFRFGKWGAPQYVEFLRTTAVPFKNRNLPHETVMFVQDNDPVHLAKSVKTFQAQQGFLSAGKHKFCSNSGDLNIVENVWGLMLDKMEGKLHSSASQLEQVVRDAARAIPRQQIQHMVNSMPRRIAECLAIGGQRLKY